MRVLCLFTCFNRKDVTLKCIDSIKRNDCIVDFLVVDDNSNDGTFEALECDGSVDVVRGTGDLYYSGGMRKAIDIAKEKDLTKYEYVLLINDDVVFYEKAIDRLIKYIDRDSVVVGATCDGTGKLSYAGLKKKSKIKPEFEYVISSSSERKKCDAFCANCVLMNKNVFIKVPNIDKKYIHSMGDIDYAFAISKMGYSIVASDFFVGTCSDNMIGNTWRDVNIKRLERVKKKESAKGLPFDIYYYFLNKNYGFFSAIIYSVTPYIRIIIGK